MCPSWGLLIFVQMLGLFERPQGWAANLTAIVGKLEGYCDSKNGGQTIMA